MTVWGLRAYGLSGVEVADGMVCFGVLTYGVYVAAVAIAGFGLWFGVFSGPAPIGLTLVPAIFATAVIIIVLSMLFADQSVTEFLERRAEHSRGRASKWWRRAAAVPRSVHAGMLAALAMVKRRDPALLGALAYWGFDIGALWASYRAFGHSPPGAVLVTGYYVGTAGNVLPLPGGIGGVEAGMIGAFVGFRVKASLATLAGPRLSDDFLLASDCPGSRRIPAPATHGRFTRPEGGVARRRRRDVSGGVGAEVRSDDCPADDRKPPGRDAVRQGQDDGAAERSGLVRVRRLEASGRCVRAALGPSPRGGLSRSRAGRRARRAHPSRPWLAPA